MYKHKIPKYTKIAAKTNYTIMQLYSMHRLLKANKQNI